MESKVRASFRASDLDRFSASKETGAGGLARPFERMQFIRGTEELYVDFALGNTAMFSFMEEVHEFYRRLLTVWAETDVDGLFFMDDWGSQRNLLQNTEVWVKIIKPMYNDYAEIVHSHGKKIFFSLGRVHFRHHPPSHRDRGGCRESPDLLHRAGAAQALCGQDHLLGGDGPAGMLVRGSPEEVAEAVRMVRDVVWSEGGVIAQCEFGAALSGEEGL